MRTNEKENARWTWIATAISAVLMIVFANAQRVHAQWNGSPNIYYNGGNVGIGTGTASPTKTLDVVSEVQVSGRQDPGYFWTSNSGNSAARNWGVFTNFNTFGDLAINQSNALNGSPYSASTTRLQISANGNVGIGTTSPGSKLDVFGDVRVRDVVGTGTQPLFYGYLNGAGRMIANLYSRDQVGVLELSLGDGSIDTKINGYGYSYFSGGNVGIGTTSPTVGHLQVQGPATGQQIYSVSTATAGGSSNFGIDAEAQGTGPLLNVGGFFNAQGATNNRGIQISAISSSAYNYAIYADAAAQSYFAGNVGIGTASPGQKLDVLGGNINVSSSGGVGGNITISGTINAKYQDVAEWVPSSERFAAGTVVVLDSTKSNQVTSSTVSYDTRVAGVVSEQPGLALGEKSDGKVLVATTGRVRVKVDASKGPIHIGDLLVTSDIPGVAMKS